jgi:DNA-directed RNA polymerase specialized sigma24 family protein
LFWVARTLPRCEQYIRPDDAKRFITPFDACASRVFAYVCRHVERSAVEDIVAETFLTAWRRTEGVPEVPLPRLLAMAAI